MLYEDKKDQDDEGCEEAIEEPYINKLNIGSRRQFRGDRALEGVHNQH